MIYILIIHVNTINILNLDIIKGFSRSTHGYYVHIRRLSTTLYSMLVRSPIIRCGKLKRILLNYIILSKQKSNQIIFSN